MKRSACRYIEKGKQLNQNIMAKVTDVFVSGSLGNVVFHRFVIAGKPLLKKFFI
jgi:hypothetical protein